MGRGPEHLQYREDLPGTLEQIYRECPDGDVPASAPTDHVPRDRSNYLVDRTLEEFGIAKEALNERCAEYIAWCEPA